MEAMETGRPERNEQARTADQGRDDQADSREAEADQRERRTDARERVLDRWEQEIAARAAELDLLDDVDEQARQRARSRRASERGQRRDDAEARRDAAIERDIEQAHRTDRTDVGETPSRSAAVTAPAAFTPLAAALQANPPLDQQLELILAAGVDALPECAAASVALVNQGRLRTAASTAGWAADLDSAQLEVGCGPLPTAADGGMVVTADLTHDERWPRLGNVPDATAARSAISVGLVVGGAVTGVLTLYADVGTPFGSQAVRIGDLLAAHANAALARTLERLTYEAQAEAWQHALASRDVIGQAKGILMEQRASTADEAFHLLRETSQRLNVKVRVVAEHVVGERRLPDA